MRDFNVGNVILISLVIFSLSGTVISVYLNLNGYDLSEETYNSWTMVFTILVAVWAVRNNKDKENIDLDWGLVFYLFWPIALFYWLTKTRGFQGLLWYIGFWLLFLLPWLASVVVYAIS